MKVGHCSERPIVEPCGLENLNYQVDTYVGCQHYCYYCYALNRAETDWSQEIRIHGDLKGQLARELDELEPQKIYLGYHTDPYQPLEAGQRQTRQALELMLEKGFTVSILTKSDLMLRDIDLLTQMDDPNISVSVAFKDNQVRRLLEADTIETGARIAALAKLKENGIRTNALLCPVIPYISDVRPLIEDLAPVAGLIWIYGISIMDESEVNWQNLKAILEKHYPDKCAEITSIIFDREHSYWLDLRQELNELKDTRGLNLNIRL